MKIILIFCLQPETFDSLATELNTIGNTISPRNGSAVTTSADHNEVDSDSDSDDDDGLTHPNKFPVEIEYHDNQYCLYKRQPTRYVCQLTSQT